MIKLWKWFQTGGDMLIIAGVAIAVPVVILGGIVYHLFGLPFF